ncbi:MBL fold metallo-hydrolase [Kitasatospora acidiphila]|uniref:MBL fold metallo-hydrolase n=1 Tax=Kitasatospora acidiphila TaxID=2567942 RepID=UPI001C68037E|nr:MBL fold metallo-hydrolase [Kitasatospora acidiphila]
MPGGWATHSEFLDERGWFPVSIGSFLARAGGRVVLVDLGLGAVDFAIPGVASFKAGAMPESLAGEGLTPADVDTVVYTHLHHDHVGWTSDVAPAPGFPEGREVGGLTFRAARHLVSAAEWRHWEGRGAFPGPDAKAVQEPLGGVTGFVADGEEIAPGVRILPTPGHTPGHSSLVVTDPAGADDRRLIVLGDIMHFSHTVHPTVPPKVEYRLTELGRTLEDPLGAIRDWAERYINEVNAARADYERRVSDGSEQLPVPPTGERRESGHPGTPRPCEVDGRGGQRATATPRSTVAPRANSAAVAEA